MSGISIWHIDRTLSNATTPALSGPRSDGNEEGLCIPQSSSISRASPSDCLVSYLGREAGGLTPPQICGRCILQFLPTGQWSVCVSDVNICIDEAWTAIDRLSAKWKSDRSDKIKQILPTCSHASTIAWLKHLKKKIRWKLHKNAMCCFK